MLSKNVGHRVQLRPPACHLDEAGQRLPPVDDDWIIRKVGEDRIDLENVRTGHTSVLGKDHVHHYTSNPSRADGRLKYAFLTLNVQVFVQGAKVRVEPNSGPGKPAALPTDRPSSLVDQLRLMDERFERIKHDYQVSGSPKRMIDTFADLTLEEKAQLYDKAIMWKKGRPSRNNPYRRR